MSNKGTIKSNSRIIKLRNRVIRVKKITKLRINGILITNMSSNKVYLYTKFNPTLIGLIKTKCPSRSFNGDAWIISEKEWNNHVKPWFDKNKQHYDIGTYEEKHDMYKKDTSQKYAIEFQSGSKTFVSGGITDSLQQALRDMGGFYASDAQMFCIPNDKLDEALEHCKSQGYIYLYDEKKKHANYASLWLEDNNLQIKGDFDTSEFMEKIKAAKFDPIAKCLVIPIKHKKAVTDYLTDKQIRLVM